MAVIFSKNHPKQIRRAHHAKENRKMVRVRKRRAGTTTKEHESVMKKREARAAATRQRQNDADVPSAGGVAEYATGDKDVPSAAPQKEGDCIPLCAMEKGQEGLPEITVLSLCPRPPSPVPPSPVLTPAPPPRTSVEDCLRNAYVAKVLQHHPESREKLVGSILMENLSIAEPPADDDDHLAAPTSNEAQNRLIEEVFARFVPGVAATKSRLSASFAGRQSALIEKSRRLQHEYQVLHNRWRRHCASLDAGEQRKAIVSAAVAKSGGRRTRSTASLAMSDVASFDDADLTANRAIIPEMVSVIGERYTFDDTNHQVETPPEHYAPIIDTWTEAEKELFLEKYAAFPKQFGLVAEFLPNKTASQCQAYYYLHKRNVGEFRRKIKKLSRASGRSAMILLRKSARRKPGRVL